MGISPYVAPKVATTSDSPVFTLFNYLPWELRHVIWEQALPPSIPQVMIYKPATFPKWDPGTNTWDAIDGPPTVPIPPPTLLHTTHESRKFALKHVLIREVPKAPTRSPAPTAFHRIVSRPFNRDTDAMFIHDRYFLDFVEMYKTTRPEAARHLIFHRITFQKRRVLSPLTLTSPWHDFISVADGSSRGLRSVNWVRWGLLDFSLMNEALGEWEERSYYRGVPEMEISSYEWGVCTPIAAGFKSLRYSGGVRWRVRVGRGVPYGAHDEEDKEGVLDCSKVTIQRFTASTSLVCADSRPPLPSRPPLRFPKDFLS